MSLVREHQVQMDVDKMGSCWGGSGLQASLLLFARCWFLQHAAWLLASQEAVHELQYLRHCRQKVQQNPARVLPPQYSQAAPPAADPMFHGPHRDHDLKAEDNDLESSG
jgi:hypothetical protein